MNSLSGVVQEEVPLVKDFPDVFPQELLGMPPDRDIEFFIELLPGTGPISKIPYRMPTKDLEKLRSRLRSYWIKAIFTQVRHLGDHHCF